MPSRASKAPAAPRKSPLEELFAGNSRINKTLWDSGERTPLTASAVNPFLEIGDVLTYYIYSTWVWTVASQSRNFTILIGQDSEGNFVSTTIDWRNGWRTANKWSLKPQSEEGRNAILEALESGELAVGDSHDWHLDIKTVRRDGKLILRKHKVPKPS